MNGLGAHFLSDVYPVFSDGRLTNVGEPGEGNPTSDYFVSCIPQFPGQVTVSICQNVDCGNSLNMAEIALWASQGYFTIPGDSECYYQLFSAWGTAGFYHEPATSTYWIKPPYTCYRKGEENKDNSLSSMITSGINQITQFISSNFNKPAMSVPEVNMSERQKW